MNSCICASLSKEKNIIDFVTINLDEFYNDDSQNEDKNNINKIYFIYVKDIESIDKIKNRYNKIIWFSDAKIDKNRKEINEFIQFNKEPISKSESYYKKNKDVNPNEYIKFQHTDSVRNNWRK